MIFPIKPSYPAGAVLPAQGRPWHYDTFDFGNPDRSHPRELGPTGREGVPSDAGT